jgi:membrane-bound metal-dependent hydrolase YbcI (DUF457 family)
MPSPVGHALGGLIVGLAMWPRPTAPRSRSTDTSSIASTSGTLGVLGTRNTLSALAVVTAAACLPDIDFLWGRHAMETHSVGAAFLAGLVVYAVSRRTDLAFACALAWCSHILFDWLGSDDFPPIGVMALWPFTDNFYFANAFVFDAISRRYRQAGFWQHNLWAVVKELLLLTPPVLALAWWRLRGRRNEEPRTKNNPRRRSAGL